MLCGSCGNKVSEVELYCYYCGEDLEVFASSTEKELEAMKMIEEHAREAVVPKQEVEEEAPGIFLDEPAAPVKETSLFLEEEHELGGGLKLDVEEESEKAEAAPKDTSAAPPQEGAKVDRDRQQQYAQFFEEQPIPHDLQKLEGEKDPES